MPKRILFIALLFFAACGLSGTILAADKYVVRVNLANVRSGPDLSKPIVKRFRGGTELSVLELVEDWYKLDLGHDKVGYILNDLVAVEEVEAKGEELAESDSETQPDTLQAETGVAEEAAAVGAAAATGAKTAAGEEAATIATGEAGETSAAEAAESDATQDAAAGTVAATAADQEAVGATEQNEARDQGEATLEEAEKRVEDPDSYLLESGDDFVWVSLILEPGVAWVSGEAGDIYQDPNFNVHVKAAAFIFKYIGFQAGFGYSYLTPSTNMYSLTGGIRGQYAPIKWLRIEPDAMFGWYHFDGSDDFGWQTGLNILFGNPFVKFAPYIGPFFSYEVAYVGQSPNPQLFTFGVAISLSNRSFRP